MIDSFVALAAFSFLNVKFPRGSVQFSTGNHTKNFPLKQQQGRLCIFCVVSSPACSLKPAIAHTSSQAEMKLTTFDIFNEQQSKKMLLYNIFHYFNNEEQRGKKEAVNSRQECMTSKELLCSFHRVWTRFQSLLHCKIHLID